MTKFPIDIGRGNSQQESRHSCIASYNLRFKQPFIRNAVNQTQGSGALRLRIAL